jgi:phenylacetate-CoA ligase
MERRGIDPAATSLKIGIFGAEPWTDQMRQTLEQRLDMHAVDIYGLSRSSVPVSPGNASRPKRRAAGKTTSTPRSSTRHRPATARLHSELVFTSLTKQAMPIIRYRTGDLTRLLPGTARTMRRIQKITGRTDDMMIVRGVNVFPTQIEELLLQESSLAPHFQCILAKDGPLDTLTITAEPAAGESTTAAETAAHHLAERIKSNIGVTVAVHILPTGTIERSTGKMRRVIDERGG